VSVLGQHSDIRAREREGGGMKWGGDLARADWVPEPIWVGTWSWVRAEFMAARMVLRAPT